MPSVDPMFASLADGLRRARARRRAERDGPRRRRGRRAVCAARAAASSCRTAASSVVWGMPGAVAAAGVADAVLPPDAIGQLDRRGGVGHDRTGRHRRSPRRRATAIDVLAALLEARTGQQIAANRAWRLDTALKPLLRERGLDVARRAGRAAARSRRARARRPDRRCAAQPGDLVLPRRRRCSTWSPTRDRCGRGARPARAHLVRGLLDRAGAAVARDAVRRARRRRAACPRSSPPTCPTPRSPARRRDAIPQFEIQRGLPVRRMMRWFDGGRRRLGRAAPSCRAMVSFRRINLVADPLPAGRFDVDPVPQRAALSLARPAGAGVRPARRARCGPTGCWCSARARR